MNEINSKEEPILYSQIEDKFNSLSQKKRIFYTNITEISQLIDNLNLEEPSNVSLIKTKFENIKNQMSKISKSINNLNNLIPDEDVPMAIKLHTLAEGITKKYKNLNSKFQNIISNPMKNIDEQISINSDISTLDKSSDISNLKNDLLINNNPLVNKDKIERLKRVKKEYQQIYDITNSMNQLSEDIKFNTLNQDKQIDIIDSNFNEIEGNIIKGNDELKKYKEVNMGDNINYYKYIAWILIAIIFLAFLIYYKLFSPNSPEVSKQLEEKIFLNNENNNLIK
jgi:hypothetical protein